MKIRAIKLVMAMSLLLMAICLHAQMPYSGLFYSGADGEGNRRLIFLGEEQDQMLVHNGNEIVPIESEDYYGSGWRTASIPAGSHSYIGFTNAPQNNLLNPIYWQEISTNSLSKLSLMANDPAGDQSFSNVNLDIREVYAGFSADKVHFAIRNAGNGFPISSGLTYFSYMALLVNPDADPADNPPVYGLMYTVNLPGVMSPGLYKITGTGFSGLSRLGDIETQIDTANNLLYLSCDWSLLQADADFAAWYDADYPLAGSMALSSRITLTSGIQEADASPAVNLLYKKQQVPAANLYAPILGEPVYVDHDGMVDISIGYYDEDANLPLVHKVLIDGVEYGDLMPFMPIDFSQSQGFYLNNVVLPPVCNTIELRFSDDGINYFSQYINYCSGVQDVIAPASVVTAYPNPFAGSVNFKASSSAGKGSKLLVYNLKGQLLREIQMDGAESIQWDGKDSQGREVGPGVYLLKPGYGSSAAAPLKVLKLK